MFCLRVRVQADTVLPDAAPMVDTVDLTGDDDEAATARRTRKRKNAAESQAQGEQGETAHEVMDLTDDSLSLSAARRKAAAATAAAAAALETAAVPARAHADDADGDAAAGGEDQPQLEKLELCTHYQSHGPPSVAALQLSNPPRPLPSYAALKAAGELARTWPFELDAFQQRSVEVLENRQHLLVAAHTSAGKTVVAEYAIAMVFRDNERRRQQQLLSAPGSAAGAIDARLPDAPRRVIYTAPIKALSNEKYRALAECDWGNGGKQEIGLMTGDVNVNPNAPLLIMTTEILRSMLYNGSETLSETSVVIFDEIHYMKDVERGIIWEESIIMLPPTIQCVFLSATLSNAREFAEWIHEIKVSPRADEGPQMSLAAVQAASSSSTAVAAAAPAPVSRVSAAANHSATCHVVYTNTRPIPLTHYMFLKGGSGIYQIKNDRKNAAAAAAAANGATDAAASANGGAIITSSLLKIQAEMLKVEAAKAAEKAAFSNLIKDAAKSSGGAPQGASFHTNRIQAQLSAARAAKRSHIPDLVRLISLCVEQKWLPAIFFSFSRRECEGMSLQAVERKYKLDLTTPQEKEMISLVWHRAMEGLDAADRQLSPLKYMYPLLMRGFAVHHSGLLPLVKEVVEILFAEGLVRVLFATETFAMGLNLPARCVIFSQLSKFDGRSTRYLQASEYIQMAGRAGRRGVDTKGIVIMMLERADLEAPAPEGSAAAQAPLLTRSHSNDSLSAAAAPASSSAVAKPEIGGMLRHLLTGSTDPLQSKFRLTYNMILNLIRCSSSFDPAYILSRSFLHFQARNPFNALTMAKAAGKGGKTLTSVSSKRARMGEGGISSLSAAGSEAATKQATALASVSDLQEELAEVDAAIAGLKLTSEQQSNILAFQATYARLRALRDDLYAACLKDPVRLLLPFLQSGRLVYVASPAVAAQNTTASSEFREAQEAVTWGWGIVVHWRMRHAAVRMEATATPATPFAAAEASMDDSNSSAAAAASSSSLPPRYHPPEYVVDVLLPVASKADGTESVLKWGEVVAPQPRAPPFGPQGWLEGEWDLNRPTSKELKAANAAVPQPPFHVVNCSLKMIAAVSAVRLYLPPTLLLSQPQAVETRAALFAVLDRATDNFAQRNLPKINVADLAPAARSADPEENRVSAALDARLAVIGQGIAECDTILTDSPVHEYSLSASVQPFLKLHAEATSLRDRLSSFSSSLGSTHLLSYRIELKTRLRILRRFKHLSAEGLITNKGQSTTRGCLLCSFLFVSFDSC